MLTQARRCPHFNRGAEPPPRGIATHAHGVISLVLAAASLFASTTVHAQTATDIEQLMIAVSTQATRLDTALTRLGEIEKIHHTADSGSVDAIANAGRQFTGAVGEATPVGLILRHMTLPDDIYFTRVVFAISANKALLAADADTAIINRSLPRIVTPAAAAESTKIRDAIVETRHLLEAFARTPE